MKTDDSGYDTKAVADVTRGALLPVLGIDPANVTDEQMHALASVIVKEIGRQNVVVRMNYTWGRMVFQAVEDEDG